MNCPQCGVEWTPQAAGETVCPGCATPAAREIECPGCKSRWALSPEESARPAYTCEQCGTVIPLSEPLPAKEPKPWWSAFLPRSDSKWVFALTMMAYMFVLSYVWNTTIHAFIPNQFGSTYAKYYNAYGWKYAVTQIGYGVVLMPILETMILAIIIEGLRLLRAPVFLRFAVAVPALCCVDGYRMWTHGVEVAPAFAIMALSYIYWRRVSLGSAFVTVVAIHMFGNGTLYTSTFMNEVKQDVDSYRTTGNPLAWERAQAIYWDAYKRLAAGDSLGAMKEMQTATALFPSESNYFAMLANAELHENKLNDAEKHAQQALKIDRQNAYAWESLSYILYAKRDYQEASDAIQFAMVLAGPSEKSRFESWNKTVDVALSGTSH